VKSAARKPPKRMHVQKTWTSKKESKRCCYWYTVVQAHVVFYGIKGILCWCKVRLAGEESAGVAVAEDVPSSIAESVEAAECRAGWGQAVSSSCSDHGGCASTGTCSSHAFLSSSWCCSQSGASLPYRCMFNFQFLSLGADMLSSEASRDENTS
jgi:hypothetical protein